MENAPGSTNVLHEHAEPITLHVKSTNPSMKAHREELGRSVAGYFERHFRIPADHRVLCFFADNDLLQNQFGGPGNKGIHFPIRDGLAAWPQDIRDLAAPIDPQTGTVSWPFASIVYLHESTCESDMGLTITFAHELQHFLQYINRRDMWATSTLLRRTGAEDLREAWQIPIEREARIVAKGVAERLLGEDKVRRYVSEKIDSPACSRDKQDWQFFELIDSSAGYDLAKETKSLVQKHKARLKDLQALAEFRDRTDFRIDFDAEDWIPVPE